MDQKIDSFKVGINYEDTLRSLSILQRGQLPFAFSKALNDTAFDVMREYKAYLPRVLNRPTTYTVNSMYVKKSTKQNLEATVGFKEWASKGTPAVKYLSHLQYGGERKPKRAEVLLRQKGLITDRQWLIPTERYQDQYGNVRRAMVLKMLSSLKATQDTAAYSKGKKAKQFFVPALRSQKYFGPNIYVRHGKGMRMFMRVVDGVKYNPIMNYDVVCEAEAIKVFPSNFSKAMQFAMSTAEYPG